MTQSSWEWAFSAVDGEKLFSKETLTSTYYGDECHLHLALPSGGHAKSSGGMSRSVAASASLVKDVADIIDN